MKRRTTVSVLGEEGQALERVLVTRSYRLAHKEATCLGCGLCADVCPLRAVELRAGVVAAGRLASRPRPELQADKCSFCGECVVVCPSRSLELTVDGQPRLLVVEGGAFPTLLAEIAADTSRCQTDCGLACRAACPVEAVSVQVAGEESAPERILAVTFDTDKCFYCGKCDAACPVDAIATARPYGGRVEVNDSLCPEGCHACADACPSRAIAVGEIVDDRRGDRPMGEAAEPRRGDRPMDEAAESRRGGRPVAPTGDRLLVDERSCFYCGACARVCPVEGALAVKRAQVRHSEVKSAAWTAALAKILSPELQARELENRARRRTKEAALGLLGLK